jgi:hypothetical protein
MNIVQLSNEMLFSKLVSSSQIKVFPALQQIIIVLLLEFMKSKVSFFIFAALCTATIMFVLSQDTLNMDLDPDSLELMLNLLESDASHKSALNDCGLSKQQLDKNKQKVRELCEEIKSNGKGVHLNLDNITVSQAFGGKSYFRDIHYYYYYFPSGRHAGNGNTVVANIETSR